MDFVTKIYDRGVRVSTFIIPPNGVLEPPAGAPGSIGITRGIRVISVEQAVSAPSGNSLILDYLRSI
jgi:hypothetical protein